MENINDNDYAGFEEFFSVLTAEEAFSESTWHLWV